ncbi:hypothetical protein [Halomicrobium salinisoli]|uniref:hypothetical protein n=1 Tax=Halomicrobium salinisoli TaxID=2878391 RepID=UPI001CF0CCC9|nr:hypothetical protein [Halomicrobium salinisoli]
MEPNVDFLAAEIDVDHHWVFAIPASASTVSQQCNEILDHVETVLDCLFPFTKFRSCEMTVQVFEEDIDYQSWINSGSKAVQTLEVRPIESDTDEDRVTIDAIRKQIERNSDSGRYIVVSSLSFREGETQIKLAESDRYISRGETDRYRTVKRGDVRGPANEDPIRIDIKDTGLPLSDTRGYEVRIRSPTEIWFGRDEVTQVNQERFAEVLSCLHEALPEGDRHFGGEPRGEGKYMAREQPWNRPLVPWFDDE